MSTDAKQTEAGSNPNTKTGNAGEIIGGVTFFSDLPSDIQPTYAAFITLLNQNSPQINSDMIGIIQDFQSGQIGADIFLARLQEI